MQAKDGNLYGVTFSGGSNGYGTIFQLTPGGLFKTLYSFDGGTNGANPRGGLVQGIDGDFYGTTFADGNSGGGTIFKITPAGNLVYLRTSLGVSNGSFVQGGANSYAALVQGPDGDFYGTTEGNTGLHLGGLSGTAFKVSTNGSITYLTFFTFQSYGPHAPLTLGSDGNFYGTTYFGGARLVSFSEPPDPGYGSLFQLTPDGNLRILFYFTGGSDGGNPSAGLLNAFDRKWYGTTTKGGLNNKGTIFSFDASVEPPAPVFQALWQTNSGVMFSWSATPGYAYQIEYTSDLTLGNWNILPINGFYPRIATNTVMTWNDWIGADQQRFYRVVQYQ
jgi:uncharacterized repeat protein (TIGR03803 family)